MSYYVQAGSTFKLIDSNAVLSNLPPNNYSVKKDMYGNFFLDQIQPFTRPSRVYGDSEGQARRILDTFNDRKGTTGVLMVGEKGSGKTLLSKMISLEALNQGMPTIVINEDHSGEDFNSFIQAIEQPCVIVFDEFEKVYDRDEQMRILTLLDGVYSSKKLFIFTANNKYGIDAHFINRPGRIYYMLEFEGLEPDFVREYCSENLRDQSFINDIVRVTLAFEAFNFDMLQTLVEEMNRYNESPQAALKVLNIKPQMMNNGESYNVALMVNGVRVPDDSLYETEIDARPLLNEVKIYITDIKEHNNETLYPEGSSIAPGTVSESQPSSLDEYYLFCPSDIYNIDEKTKTYRYRNSNGDELVLKKQKPNVYAL